MALLHVYKPQVAAAATSIILIAAIIILPTWAAILPLMVLCLVAYWLHRSQLLEQQFVVNRKERLLIVAPHQDDCVISAAGLAQQVIKNGGTVTIVYVTQDEHYTATRQKECINSWKLAGVTAANLLQWNILPGLFEQNSRKIYSAATKLQTIVDELQPTTIVFPLFEGGHSQHDIVHHIITKMIVINPAVTLLEAPMYNLYYAIGHTPHKWLKIATKILSLGLAKYYNPREGIDGRPVLVLNMTKAEQMTKQQMLRLFKSQGGASLANAFGHNDRFYRYQPTPFKAQAFDYQKNLASYIEKIYNALPQPIARLLFGGKYCCFGCTTGITNLQTVLQSDSIVIPGRFEVAEETAVAV
jgi:LmbE family N-acetylglucosaminyl deacetylase